MNPIAGKAFLLVLLSVSYLYSGQVPQEGEKFIDAPLEEVDLCHRLFGLQAECEAENAWLYSLFGGLFGTCAAVVKRSCHASSLIRSSKFLGIIAIGALIGGYLSARAQKAHTKSVLAARTLTYFPESYMAGLQGVLEHGEHVYIHRFKESGERAQVGESIIKQWHALAESRNCFVCYKHAVTKQLIAKVPYYTPEACNIYKDRIELIGQPLNAPISYDREQELNPCFGNTSGGLFSGSLPYAHDGRQDWYGCSRDWRSRRIGLPTLGMHINSGRILDDNQLDNIVEAYEMAHD